MAIEKLSVILELVSGNYMREARNAANATGQIGNSAKSVTGQLGAMIGPAAIGGAILGLGKMAIAAGENADRLFDLQAQTGLSTDALQEWEFVAKAAGATTEVFSDAVKAIIKNLSEAANGTGAAAKAYDALGVSVKDANGNLREGGEITAEVFDKLAGMTNITERNALAQDIFGKKWEETISILDLGTEALGNLREEGKKGVVSAEALRNSDKFRETWQKFLAQVGPKLNEALGKIAPALTTIADAAIDALEAMEPLIDVLGFVADKFSDANAAIEQGKDSPSKWAQSWAVAGDIGQGAIFGVVGMLGALFDEENRLKDNTAEATGEISDSWARMGAAFTPIIGSTITMLDRQSTSHRNVAKAAESQRQAMINLTTTQADLLDPLRTVLLLQKENTEAQKRLTEAHANGKTSASELAVAIIEAEQAELRLNAAGAALSSEQISEFANLLITDFGMSQIAALDLLDTLGLLDGWEGRGRFVLTMDTVSSGTSGVRGTGNVNSLFDEFGFASGGIVPGPMGSQQVVLAHGGETILPTHRTGPVGNSMQIVVQSPMGNFRQDLQYATILASVTNLVEGF